MTGRCIDCGHPIPETGGRLPVDSPRLCPACIALAHRMGFTADERVAMLQRPRTPRKVRND